MGSRSSFVWWWVVVLVADPAISEYLLDEKSQLRLEVKADLARSYFEKEFRETGDKSVINVTHTPLAQLHMSSPGENVRIFRSADENFFFTGSDLYQLEKGESPKSRYVLNAVHDVRLDEGAVFFKNAEWNGRIFLVVCYQRGYCEIRISARTLAQNLKLRINTAILPLDVTFFATESDFYMVTVLDPVTIYRWTGTYFNEDYRLDTTGAQSVAVIQDGRKSIIVVAQNLGRNKVYSKVFIREGDNIELFQLLPSHQALRVVPFRLSHGEDVLHYIFVLNNVQSSAIFFWTGKEFVFWKKLDNIYGQRIVYVGEIESRIFFFISDQNKLYLYHPTPTDFSLAQIILFDQNLVGIDVRRERHQYPMLVALTGSPMDPYYKVNLLLLKVIIDDRRTDKEKLEEKPRGVWKCLEDLKEELGERREKLNQIYSLVIRDGFSAPDDSTPLSLAVEKLASLDRSMVELAEAVEDMETRMGNLLENTGEGGRTPKYHVRGDLVINHMEADVIDVQVLNGRNPPPLENLLSVEKDQTFRGKIHFKTLAANSLITPSINAISVNDIMLRNKEFQSVSGDFTLTSLRAQDIKFGPSGRLNQIPMTDIVTNENASEKPIRGPKVFSKLRVRQIEADKINDVPAGEWLSTILPSFRDANEEEEEPLNFTGLSVEKLWISKLNGIPWEEFLHSIYLPSNNETIRGNLTVKGTARVRNLKTNSINGIPLLPEDSLPRERSSCPLGHSKKMVKSLPLDVNIDWDDPLLKEVLNEPESENEVRFFPDARTLLGDLRAARVFVRNPLVLAGKETDLTNLTDRLWMRDEHQVINVDVEFSNDCFIQNLSSVKTINGKPLDSFVRIDRPNQISTKLIFNNVHIQGNVTLDSNATQNLNLRHQRGNSNESNSDGTPKPSLRFLGTVKTRRLNANLFNGLDLNDPGNRLQEDLQNSGTLEVTELIIGGNLTVKNGLQVNVLNGIDFNETVSSILTWNDPNVLSKAHFESLSVQSLHADTINGIQIEDKLSALSKSPDRHVSVIIEGSLKVPSLRANTINALNFDEFMRQVFIRNEPHTETIRGEKTFRETVTITGNLQGTLNAYDVTELEKMALSKTKPQTITGRYTVEELNANHVEAEYLDGISTQQLLFQDETSQQLINSDVVLNNVAVAGNVKAADFMNGCDLSKIGKIDLKNTHQFGNVLVKGAVTWDSPRNEAASLNYFLTNAVSKSEDEVISGSVTFESDVTMGSVTGGDHLNGVNLSFIAEDGIFKSPKEEQEMFAPLTFKGRVKVNSIVIENNVLVDTINDIDITDIGQRLVRKNADTLVRGRKVFRNGFSANNFNADTINGAKTSQIVFYDEVKDNKELFLPSATFNNLVVFNDLTVSRINGHRLAQIFEDRLLKREEKSSEGNNIYGNITIQGNVAIKGHTHMRTINGLQVEDTVLATGEPTARVITGDIEFLNGLSIAERVQVDYVNGENITALYEKALMVDEDAVVEGNIEFLDEVTVEGDITVEGTINECNLEEATSTELGEGKPQAEEDYQEALRTRMNLLSNLTATINKPLVFMYLNKAAKLDLQLPSMHSTSFNQYSDVAEFNVYGMNQRGCGLPEDCYCPTQTNVFIQSLSPPAIRVEPNSTRFFKHFDKKLQVEVTVTTTTVSYSSRCMRNDGELDSEHTSISWRTFQNDETIFELNVETGFLSDVKFFRLGDSIYAVMAFYFHPHRNETNNLHTVVYEIQVNNKTLEKVDEIPSTGVQVLEVFWTMKGVVLVVGNSFDSDRFTDSVNSGVYRFNEDKNKFELLRFVKTHGILAIKSMRYKKTSFIFFVQKQTWPLLILKYNQEYDNYYFSQKLDTTRARIRSNFLSLSVISTGSEGYSGDVFIGIVLSDDNFRLFKYKHIEGFVEESYQEQNNVRLLHPFWVGSSQYLLAGSASDSSAIYKIIEQGR